MANFVEWDAALKVAGKNHRAVEWVDDAVVWIEQRLLPHRFELITSRDPEAVAVAIESMQVRGAPTIGATAAFGLALAFQQDRQRFEEHWLPRFRRTRPTAVNLFHACDQMAALAADDVSAEQMADAAMAYADAEVACNRTIGAYLAALLAVGERRILTHCNAGWLAAVDWGTAVSGIYCLARAGESPFVWVDETRPRLQGMRLTAWELMQENVDYKLQADNAAAWMMAQGKVDAIVVGADRIAANGDVANKIGTYMLALAAREHGVPFYVAAPSSTFDPACADGGGIPIEQREAVEVIEVDGVDARENVIRLRIAPQGAAVNNPAFDVTPAACVSGIVSEKGLWRPGCGE
ncbi:MAG: S-methyl-5-thioribose-1-phosphate isomerase [Mariprofundaceae bacterium]